MCEALVRLYDPDAEVELALLEKKPHGQLVALPERPIIVQWEPVLHHGDVRDVRDRLDILEPLAGGWLVQVELAHVLAKVYCQLARQAVQRLRVVARLVALLAAEHRGGRYTARALPIGRPAPLR